MRVHVVRSRIIHLTNLLGVLRHVEISSELRIMWASFLEDRLAVKLLPFFEGLDIIKLQTPVHLHK